MTRQLPSSTAFRPKQYSKDLITVSNIIHRRRHAMEWQMENMILNLDCSPVPATYTGNNSNMRYLHTRVGIEKIVLGLPEQLVTLILNNFGNGEILIQDNDLSPLLLTLGLEPAIEEIEQQLDLDVSLDVLDSSLADSLTSGLEFEVEIKDQFFKIQVLCELGGLQLISQLLSVVDIVNFPLALKTQARFEIARKRLFISELEALEHGDVIVLSRARIDHNNVMIVINAGLKCQGHILEDGTIQVISQPRQYHNMDEMDYINEDEHEPNTDHDINLGALQVSLSFELGRQQVSFEELSSITQGYTFTMPPQNTGGITILANGQAVGKGEIVQIGELTGVRVTRLFGNGQ